jgi:hypothetical protein
LTTEAPAVHAHRWSVEDLNRSVEAAGIALWTWNVDDDGFTMDEAGFRLWGIPLKQRVTFEELSAHIHPADRDRVRAAFAATRAVVGSYETDFRILLGDEVRWIASRGRGDDVGMVARIMFGIFLDVTGRKQAEEGHELLAGEMSHRVKNLLAIAAGLAQITSRSTSSTTDMARELTQRLTALGRAHDLVRPLPAGKAAPPCSAISSRCCSRPMTISAPSAAGSGSRSSAWASARRRRPAWRWSSTNLRPTRSNTAR